MSDRLAKYINKSVEQLTSAKLLMTMPAASAMAVHHCYYAYFWLVRGLLLEKGIVAKKHSGAHQMFGLHFIKPGEIPTLYSDYLFDLFEQRQIADYDPDGEFDSEQVEQLIQKADDFLTFVKITMPNLLILCFLTIALQPLSLSPDQKHPRKKAKTTVRATTNSLCGTVVEKRGNQMPTPDQPRSAGQPVVREVAAFPLLAIDQVESDDAGFITDLKGAKPLQTVQSGKDGKFCFSKLPAGRYSVLVHESKGWYANSFDTQNHINPVTVQVGKTAAMTLEITHRAAF